MTLPSPEPRKVAIVTGASQGIGEGIAAGVPSGGDAVVATSRSIHPSGEPGVLGRNSSTGLHRRISPTAQNAALGGEPA